MTFKGQILSKSEMDNNSSSSSLSGALANVWCHQCNTPCQAQENLGNGEYECLSCHSSFVELIEQNHNSNNTVSASPNGNAMDITGNAAVQNILQSLLGIQGANNVDFIGRGDNNDSRPIGILIHQAASGSLNGMEIVFNRTDPAAGSTDGLASARGVLGLLNALTSNQSNTMTDQNTQFEQFLHHILMNENSHSGAPPLSDNLISSLPRESVTEFSDLGTLGECSITQEIFGVGDVVVSLPCGHKYKDEAITHWLKMHNTCPVCRVSIEPTAAAAASDNI